MALQSRTCIKCGKLTEEKWCWSCDCATSEHVRHIKPTPNGDDVQIGSDPMAGARLEWNLQMEALMARELNRRSQALLVSGLWPASKDGPSRFDDRSEVVEGLGEVNGWHFARAKGMVQKWARIRACETSTDFLVSACGCHEIRIGCGHRECPKCRGVRATQTQKKVKRTRIALRNEARARHCDRRVRERFLTLTAPHYTGPNAARRRVEILFDAWKVFADWFRRHLRSIAKNDAELELCHFWRMFEWTEGKDDGKGHPHFHVWVHSPWLDQSAIHEAWQRALAKASGEDREVAKPDLRIVGKDVERELVKYMLKDFSDVARHEMVPPVVAAAVLIELLSRRRQQTSRGLSDWSTRAAVRATAEEPAVCKSCGEVHHPSSFWTFRQRPSAGPSPPPN